jgi:hypothetical protein
MKICKKCLKELPLSLFYKHKAMKDGLLSFCIECVKSRVKVHRDANLEQVKQYDRLRGRTEKRKQKVKEYGKKNAKKLAEYSYEWRKRNLMKARAHCKVARAIRKGILNKQCCKICSNEKVEAHHPNYNEPLNVVWLCRQHHAELHRKYND